MRPTIVCGAICALCVMIAAIPLRAATVTPGTCIDGGLVFDVIVGDELDARKILDFSGGPALAALEGSVLSTLAFRTATASAIRIVRGRTI